mmetsp:Transcript_64232/g.106254  ORF Transcript_64232/g.106254 Transcript_64232/m.106254 type:complete len:102 (+) Transcript_64232:272-577(+)
MCFVATWYFAFMNEEIGSTPRTSLCINKFVENQAFWGIKIFLCMKNFLHSFLHEEHCGILCACFVAQGEAPPGAHYFLVVDFFCCAYLLHMHAHCGSTSES